MNKQQKEIKIVILCAIAVAINVTLGSIATSINMPLFYLDAIGTIFIAVNFPMKYGVLTGLCTNFILGIIFGPLALPFSFVSMTIAIVTNILAKKGFGFKNAFFTGILLALSGAIVSTPIRLLLYGGFSNSMTDTLIFSIRASGKSIITAAFWGAFIDSLLDKIISCLFISWLIHIPQLKKELTSLHTVKGETL